MSGVGPADLLSRFGIEVVADNPFVGQSYQDQPTVHYIFKTAIEFPFSSKQNFEEEMAHNPAYFDINGPNPVVIHATSPYQSTPISDLQIDLWEGFALGSMLCGGDAAFMGYGVASFFTMHQTPETTGSVNITGPSIFDGLSIDNGWKQLAEYDKNVLRFAYDAIHKIRQTPWGQYLIELEGDQPTADEFIKHNMGSALHPASKFCQKNSQNLLTNNFLFKALVLSENV